MGLSEQLYRCYEQDNYDMKNVLCRVRAVNWREAERRAQSPVNERKVGRYYKAFINDENLNNEWSNIINNNFSGLNSWRSMTADEIIQEIRSSPEECRRSFNFILMRYVAACKAYLIDIAITNEWQIYFVERFRESGELAAEEVPEYTGKIEREAWEFCHFLDEDVDVSIRDLMERMFTIQKIQSFLSNTDGAAAVDRDSVPQCLQANELSAENRCFQFVEKCHKSAAPEDLRFFGELKKGAPRTGKKTQKQYISELYTLFKSESEVLAADSVFTKAYKAYKGKLKEKRY